MIKIGDFSKLAHVSIKTLHHYDELGLLSPVQVDRYNGYRYYEVGQLSRLNRILALKDLGFSLEQVAELLQENLPTAELRGMLRLKQMELAGLVEEEQARLWRVEQRLRQLEHERNPLEAAVAVKATRRIPPPCRRPTPPFTHGHRATATRSPVRTARST